MPQCIDTVLQVAFLLLWWILSSHKQYWVRVFHCFCKVNAISTKQWKSSHLKIKTHGATAIDWKMKNTMAQTAIMYLHATGNKAVSTVAPAINWAHNFERSKVSGWCKSNKTTVINSFGLKMLDDKVTYYFFDTWISVVKVLLCFHVKLKSNCFLS